MCTFYSRLFINSAANGVGSRNALIMALSRVQSIWLTGDSIPNEITQIQDAEDTLII